MQTTAWLILVAIIAVLGFGVWLARKRWIERGRAASAREAQFMSGFAPQAPSPSPALPARKDAGTLPQQKLLFEAALKAAEAGEPVLSIQLYARLLARYPDTGFASQVRAAVAVQKKKLAAKA
ncbi:MAG: hypothetical protein ACT4P3_08895 [Betaproteobacteria bacterium]